MLVAALVAGATSMGADVHRLGVCPTPALAHVTAAAGFGAGIMVSASHNPADDNGLKVLDGEGLKLDDALEDELEALIWRADELASPTNDGLGPGASTRAAALDRYLEHRLGARARASARRLRVDVDCANGSGGAVAPRDPRRHRRLASSVHFDEPDGIEHQPRLRRHGARGAGRAS